MGNGVAPEWSAFMTASSTVPGLMSNSDKVKLDGIATNANNFTLLPATNEALGGIKIGYSENGKNFAVQ